jgi:hypothetical protein
VNDVFAGKTSDIGAGAADPFPLHYSDSLTFLSERPGNEFRAFSAAENDEVVFFGNDLVDCRRYCQWLSPPQRMLSGNHGLWDKI